MTYTLYKEEQGHAYIKVEMVKHPELLENESKRVLIWFETGNKAHLALRKPKTMDQPVVYLSSNLCRSLGLKAGDEFQAQILPDESPFQFDMPEEFQAVLDTDPAASAVFERLTPGNQRSLIYLVQALKSVDKRIERSLLVASKLRAGIHSAREILRKS
ncbi:MAG TPA: YdeI/OmpD-associated family protein [Catalimonadaceae bacterium]|nr:YdeI/OmpD-associated family protein [Catalimonadaceae bacterium]HPI12132.1 YdeI/OmpD-associated family protein [Catalimonadaceae bacterium]